MIVFSVIKFQKWASRNWENGFGVFCVSWKLPSVFLKQNVPIYINNIREWGRETAHNLYCTYCASFYITTTRLSVGMNNTFTSKHCLLSPRCKLVMNIIPGKIHRQSCGMLHQEQDTNSAISRTVRITVWRRHDFTMYFCYIYQY